MVHIGQINSLCYFDNGGKQLLFSVGNDKKIACIDFSTADLKDVQSAKFYIDNAHKETILSICVIANRFVATGGLDGSICFWKINENEPSSSQFHGIKKYNSKNSFIGKGYL